jgi:hypothetical protein
MFIYNYLSQNYMSLMEKKFSLVQNIDNLCFSKKRLYGKNFQVFTFLCSDMPKTIWQ